MPKRDACIRRSRLGRLVLNLSQDCNLRCSYCYAAAGGYGSRRVLMGSRRAAATADAFLARFDLGSIQFFGGEPFLNPRAMAAVCERAAAACARDNRPVPAFTAVTNGTVLSPAIIALIRRYRIHVTVSLDGDRALHDGQRFFRNGKGSFDRIVRNIHVLQDATGEPGQIEGTFTARHLEAGFSLEDFMSFAARDLGVHRLHMPWIMGTGYGGGAIPPTAANRKRLTGLYSAAAAASLASLLGGSLEETILLSGVEREIRRRLSGRNGGGAQICAAGLDTLSAAADGAVYPCFMFTNKEPFRLGQVDGLGDPGFARRRAAFVKSLKVPDCGPPPLSSCAGQNLDLNGGVCRVHAATAAVMKALHRDLCRRLDPVEADEDRWNWVRAKLMLLELAAVPEREAA
jgi:uncharacterized protein